MKIKHVCFDLDGVLINSIEVMKLSWEGSCKKLNIQIPFSFGTSSKVSTNMAPRFFNFSTT